MLSRAGLVSLSDTLKLLEAYKVETAEPVWDVMSLVIGDTRRFVDLDEKLEESIKTFIASLIATEFARLGWEEQPDETPADQKLRATIIGLGAYAEDPRIIERALKLFDHFKQDTTDIPAELRGIILAVAVKQKYADALDYLIDLYGKTQNSDLQRDIAGAITATKSPEDAVKLLSLITDAALVKPQDADRWLFYLLRNRHIRDLAWQWMVDNWKWIETTYHNDKSYDYFPRYAAAVCNTSAMQEKYIAFFEPKMSEPVLKRNIAIGMEEIANRAAWLERDLPGVKQFFSKT
jgi:aminopeptidase N